MNQKERLSFVRELMRQVALEVEEIAKEAPDSWGGFELWQMIADETEVLTNAAYGCKARGRKEKMRYAAEYFEAARKAEKAGGS